VPGALLGLVLASVIGSVAMYLKPPGLPKIDLTADPRGLIFAAVAAILALLVIGLMPALQSVRNDVITDLKAADRYGRGGIRVGGVRGGLIVVQVALSVAFTAASGLIVFALSRHSEANRFDSKAVMVAPVTVLPGAGDSVLAAARLQQIVARIGALPGITGASIARLVPNTGSRTTTDVTLARNRVVQGVEANLVRPGYFGVIGLPIVGGRDFVDRDMTYGGTAAIVSQALAARLWPGENPLGKTFSDWRRPLEVVGVVGELRTNLPRGNTGGLLYVPLLPQSGDNLIVHLRTNGPSEAFAASVGRELRQHNRYIAGSDVMTLSEFIDGRLIAERTMAKAAAVLAVLQLLLAIAGLSGLVAYVTAQRRREIGIRAALGADNRSILALVLTQGVKLMGVGAVVGIVLSIAVGQVLATQLPVSVWIGIRAVLLAIGSSVVVAGVAMLLPARRALSVTPATALRVD
jgi:putative ABC transport system permease protein